MNLDAHPKLPDDKLPVRDSSHSIKRIPCCLYVQDSEGNNILKLNDSSSLIWSLCEGKFTIREIIDMLEESYPDAGDVIEKDVYRVLDEFLAEEIITLQSPSS